ncbi:MAG: T9SS type A sorting domain-containing protein, partial [Ignavibacteriota bacterium]
ASQYVGIISDSMNAIRISVNGAAEQTIPTTGFISKLSFSNLSKMFNSKGTQFDVASNTYYLHSDIPFICYTYGMSTTSLNLGFGGTYTFAFEYAAPAGMQLNTGVPPDFQVTVTTLPSCGGWHVCVKDNSPTNAGIKAVSLVDDPDGVYYKRPGTKFKNVSFDASSPDLYAGELHPDPEINPGAQYCFDVKIDNRLAEAVAPLGIVDRNGNGLLYRLFRSAPTVNLATSPVASTKPDSIFFPQQKVGVEICTTFVVKNTAPSGGSPLAFLGVKLAHADASFTIKSITPSLPAQINAQQDLTIELCYTAKDSLRHFDSLIISNDCFDIPISLDAHSSTGLITADDIAFGDLDTGKTVCKNVTIKNIGSAPYTLLASPTLSDNVNFNIDPTFLASLPIVLKAGEKRTVSVCFHPKAVGSDSAGIVWLTDIDASFANAGKKYSSLTGTGLEVITGGVRSSDDAGNTLTVRPNPASGSSVSISFNLPTKGKATLAVFDVLGREITHFNFNRGTDVFELPIGPFKQGMYYVRLTSDNVILTQKLEVSH